MNVRPDFPILERKLGDRPLVYLDSAATSLRPSAVIAAMSAYYSGYSGNVFRGNHRLAEEASIAFDDARVAVAAHIGADPLDLIFTANTTDAINMVAGGMRLAKTDRVLVPVSEHHSNLLPWLRAATVETLPIDGEGFVDPDELRRRLERPARAVAIGHASNVTGAIQSIRELGAVCRERGVPLVVDGAQAAPHLPVKVSELGCDYYAFSAHKMLGPTGIGALWARAELLEQMEPPRLGGGTIVRVLEGSYQLKDLPHRLEAGTPHVDGAIGFGAAARYLAALGMDAVARHEQELTAHLLARLADVPGVKVFGPHTADRRLGVVSMQFANASVDRVAKDLDARYAIMVRQGQHCAQPLMSHLGCTSALRVSAYVYTSTEELDAFVAALQELLQ